MKQKRYLLTFLLLLVASMATMAQVSPTFNNYYLNPALYNPAHLTSASYSTLRITHKQQWLGIEGAPVTTTASLQIPVSNTIGVGLTLQNDKRGIINTNIALASFAYKAQFDKNHYIQFGLAAGAGINGTDLTSEETAGDQALLSLLESNMFLEGKVGINYHIGEFDLGISVPNVFQSRFITDQAFNPIEVEPLDNILLMASYSFEVAPNMLYFEPSILYRYFENQEDNIEATAIINIKNRLWGGASYRQNYGLGALIGFNLADRYNIGYAYEFASGIADQFGSGSHEIHASIRLGKKKKPVSNPTVFKKGKKGNSNAKVSDYTSKRNPRLNLGFEESEAVGFEGESDAEEKEETETKTEPIKTGPINPAKVKSTPILQKSVKKGSHKLELEKGSYVSVSTSLDFDKAVKYSNDLLQKLGYVTNVGYNSSSKLFYVYIFESKSKQTALREGYRLRKSAGLEDAELITVY